MKKMKNIIESQSRHSSGHADPGSSGAPHREEFQRSETDFRNLFEYAPSAIWVEDFSGVRQYLDDLRSTGVTDIQAYLDAHPEEIAACVARVRIVDANRAAQHLYEADSKEQLLVALSAFFDSDSLPSFKEELLALARGETMIERELSDRTLRGQRRAVQVRLVVPPGYEESWARVFVSTIDITTHKQIQEALRQSEERFKLMAWATKDAVWDWDLQTNEVWWGEGLQKVFHYPSDLSQTSPQWWIEHIHPNDQPKVTRTITDALDTGMEFWSKEYRFQQKNGSYVDVMDRGYILRDEQGAPYRMVGAMLDISYRKQAEQALLESEERYRQIVETAGDLIYRVDASGVLTYINPTALRIMGFRSEGEVLGHHYLEFVHPAWRERVKFTYNRQFTKKILNTYFEFLAVTRQRQEIWLGQTAQIILENDRVNGFQVVGRDITSQKQAEAALQEANYKMRQFVEELQRRNREIDLLNEMSRLLQACGSPEEGYKIVAEISSLMFPGTAGAFYVRNEDSSFTHAVTSWGGLPPVEEPSVADPCRAGHCFAARPQNFEYLRLHCHHHPAPLPAASFCLPLRVQGEMAGILYLQSQNESNVDALKRQLASTVVEQAGVILSNLKLREALREQSIRDPLTGLYNRRYMEEALQKQLAASTDQERLFCIIMIDIDHFKRFNDTHGHAAGDQLLRQLGHFLQERIRDEDIACRYGGEEFMLILPDVPPEIAWHRAEQLRREVEHLRLRDTAQSDEGITLSLGVAVYPIHGHDLDAILHAADAALYQAKQEGRDRVVVTAPTS